MGPFSRCLGYVLVALAAPDVLSAYTLTLTSAPNPANYGQPVTITATFSSAVTGRVTFYDGVSVLGIRTISGSSASLTTTLLPSGSRSLTAFYSGDPGNPAGTATPFVQTIAPVTSRGLRPAVNYSVGTQPNSVTVADFNGDHVQDLAVTNSNSSNISILLGNGDGTFRAAVNYAVASFPTAVAVGDWNGDGVPDLAVSNSLSSPRVSLLLGKGDGTFQAATTITGAAYGELAAGDFNGDGKMDLAVAGIGLHIFLGNGDGTFQSPVNYTSTPNLLSITAGDLNLDGKIDLVCGNGTGQINVYLGNGDGTFRAAVKYAAGYSSVVSIGDFNRDGKPDLIATDYYSGILLYLGNGDGTLQAPTTFNTNTNPYAATAVDLDGDGKLDAVYTSPYFNSNAALFVLFGDGSGAFPNFLIYPVPRSFGHLTVGDFNGDGTVDIVVTDPDQNQVSVLLGGAITDLSLALSHGYGFTQGQTGASYKLTVSNAGDIASSGTVGVGMTLPAGFTATAITGSGWSCTLSTLTCTRSDSLAPAASYPPIQITVNVGSQVRSVVGVGTVAGGSDGYAANNLAFDTTNVRYSTTLSLTSSPNPSLLGQPVILTASVASGTGNVTFYDGATLLGVATISSGKAVLSTVQLPAGSHSLTARLDGDTNYGPALSAVRSHVVNSVATNGLQPGFSFKTGNGLASVAVGDFNRDGKLDVVTGNYSDISVLLGKGDGSFQPAVSYAPTDANTATVAVGDLDSDGKLDIAVAYQDGSVAILLGNGDGTFKSPVKVATGSYAGTIGVADIDRDGRADLLILNNSGIVVFLGNGDGTFQPPLITHVANFWAQLAVLADLNNDGSPDVIFSSSNYTLNFWVLLSNGDGTFQPPATYTGANANVYGIAAGDFNGDGKLDFVQLDWLVASVLKGNGDGSFQNPVSSYFSGLNAPYPTVTSGDFNADGKLDVVYSGNTTTILFGDGSGLFPAATQIPGAAGIPLVADFNGDGRPDLLIASADFYNLTPGTVNIFLGGQFSGLGVTSTHVGKFTAGAPGSFQIVVSNFAFATTAGAVSVTDTLPAGLTAAAISGDGWTCALSTLTCTRTDGLANGNPFAPITLLVSVAAGLSPSSLTNQVTVSNNGAVNTATDATTIVTPSTTTLTLSPSSSTLSQPVTLTATVTGAGTVSGSVSFFDGTALLGTATLTSGHAAFTTRLLPAGRRTLSATFSGDATHGASHSLNQTFDVTAGAVSGFAPNTVYATGLGPVAIVSGDFNGDGKTDLVTVNSNANSVSVLLGNGDGTFRTKVDYSVGRQPASIIVGDVNGDGRQDLVVDNTNESSLSILLGNGDGTFQPAITTALSGIPYNLCAADFDQDSKLDLVVTLGSGYVTVLFGNGDGTFRVGANPILTSDFATLTGDFNGDGKADVLVGQNGAFNLYLGNGDGTFQKPVYSSASNYPGVMITGDLDGDGRLDLVSTSYNGGINVSLGKADGTFQLGVFYPTGLLPGGSAIADVNGDGKPDVVVANYGSNTISILFGNGDGTLAPAVSYTVGSEPQNIVAGDFNGDGRTDIAVANQASNNVTIFLGTVTQVLQVSSAHTGNFLFNQTGATYTLTVTNGGPGAFSGALSVVDTLPAGLTATGIGGAGWTCTLSTLTCTQTASLALGAATQPITVTVNVAASGPTQVTNRVTASGPGAISATAVDLTAITALPPPIPVSPGAGQTGVPLNATLSWTAAAGATSYDLYLGTQTTPPFLANTAATSYAPAALAAGTVYYWRIVSKNSAGSATSPTVSFMTGSSGNLVFASQPQSTSPGTLLPDIQVEIRDNSGALVTTSNAAITLTSTPTGINTTINASGGIAIFSGLAFPTPGTYTLTAFAAGFSTATSATFTISTANTFTVSGRVTVSGSGLSGVAINATGAQTLSTTTDTTGSYTLTLGKSGSYLISAARSGYSFSSPQSFPALNANQSANFTGVAIAGLAFYPVPPCRVADTRSAANFPATFGAPTMIAGQTRTFPIPSSSCGIPSNASAYSLNFTAVPPAPGGYLGLLTTFPTGQARPNASTLNSYTGTVVANAAIVPAGANGAIDVYVSDRTDVLFDIDGYFAPPTTTTGLLFFSVAPCRVADTRSAANFPALFGAPTMTAGQTRSFPVPSSSCGIAADAQAYSFNFTVVPPVSGYLGLLTTWPAGIARPNASTLNSYTGTVVANAAIVPAGANGAVSVYVSDATDVLFDVNGYFAHRTGGLSFYPVAPCRVVDTRSAASFPAPFGAPTMTAGQSRSFPLPQSACGIPATAQAYSLNVTVVPLAGGYLGLLTTWPTGQARPNASTLNSYTGTVVANAAIVPASPTGSIDVYVSHATDVILDINGYFAP